MELHHLETFVAVAEERHFRAAARRLHLSPPSVTDHIHALERAVGTPLLIRVPSVQLTPAGAALLARARRLLADAEDARRAARAVAAAGGADSLTGELRVGVMSNGAGEVTAAAIRAFMTAQPRVRVRVQRLDFTDHVESLIEQHVDLAFVRPAPRDDRLVATTLTPDPRVLVVPQSHPFADAADGLDVADALDSPFVGISADAPPSFTEYLYLATARNGETARRTGDACRDVTDVLAAVAAGRGIASAAESFRGYAGWPGVAYISLRGVGPALNTLVRRRDDLRPETAAFVAHAEACAATAAADLA